jgi:hypothetical protein
MLVSKISQKISTWHDLIGCACMKVLQCQCILIKSISVSKRNKCYMLKVYMDDVIIKSQQEVWLHSSSKEGVRAGKETHNEV